MCCRWAFSGGVHGNAIAKPSAVLRPSGLAGFQTSLMSIAQDLGAPRAGAEPSAEPVWSDVFLDDLDLLFQWRRDVRRFRTDPVSEALIEACLAAAMAAPSVGYSQPWRFVLVESPDRRRAIAANYEMANREALAGYDGARRALYAGLKLAGLGEAPVHLAVLCDERTAVGHGLGRASMPETLRYSVVCAVHSFWLAARARGLGVGWVSILAPTGVLETIEAPPGMSLVAYLCVGWPEAVADRPELETAGWESKVAPAKLAWRC